jgi:hypothetical protein
MRRIGFGIAVASTLIAACSASSHFGHSGAEETADTREADCSSADAGATGTAPAGPTCNGPQGLVPPSLSLTDFQSILGNVQYYAQPQNFGLLFNDGWTDWYYDTLTTGLAKLSTMRGVLEQYNLSDTYLPGGRPAPVDCTGKLAVRQTDGTCNDPTDTMMGAVNVRFGRNIPVLLPDPDAGAPGYVPNPFVYPDEATLMTPDPRTVSRTLFTRGGNFKPIPFLNMLSAAWIQFQVHDWLNHGANSTTDVFHIPLDADDPLRRFNITQMVLGKTVPDARQGAELALLPPVYKNAVTHWWDGSQIYGSDQATADSLRDRDAHGNLLATLTVGPDGLLPAESDGFEQTGFRDNWWIGLALMHNLFSQEHNSIVAMLRASHPEMDEQALYDHARLINAADIAKIHTIEWTPAILPNPTLGVAMNANWSGLKTYAAPGTDLTGLLAYVNTLPPAESAGIIAAMEGVAGGTRNLQGVPYSITEEFTSVYRMHALLPESLDVLSAKTGAVVKNVPLAKARNADARALEVKYGVRDLLYTFGVAHPGALVPLNYPAFMQALELPFGIVDMGTVDILRDRERGVPRYNDFREQLRLPRVASIEALTDDTDIQARLHKVYGAGDDAINQVDLLVGTFAEAQRPTCYGFGETLFQVFTLMATRRLQADRFFTTDFTPAVYTDEGMAWIAGTSMKTVLLRHYRELASTGLAGVSNAFYPWK